MFESLKKVNAIVGSKDLNTVFSNIKTAKTSLDAFCRKIKEQISVKYEAPAKVETKTETAQVAQPKQAEQKQHKTFSSNQQNNSYQNRSNNSEGTRPSYQNRGNNSSYQNRGGSSSYQQNDRKNNYNNGTRYNNYQDKDKDDKKVSFTSNKVKTKPTGFEEPIHTKQNTLGGNKNKSKHSSNDEKRGLSTKEKIRMGHIRFNEKSYDADDGVVRVKGKKHKTVHKQERKVITHVVITEDNLTVKMLSEKMGITAAEIIKKLLLLGLMYNINSVIDYPTAELIAAEFNITLEKNIEKTYEEKLADMFEVNEDADTKNMQKRPPVVTVMGHVDHGKTSLLDYIKKSHVILNEAGGITQHMGAYSIDVNNENITFIDTPGHAAFKHMRKRGAKVADIAILIVAADDGIMPQTVEAIKHIKEANIPMIVAVNKIDKPGANLEKIKQQLTEHDVLIEEWGGDTILVPISAHTGEGIEKLLEMILLVSDMNEFLATPNKDASGTCLEAKVETGRGIVATIIVNDGTLHIGDYMVCGLASGRVRAMTNYKGEAVTEAGPSMAVSVVGLSSVPFAGDLAYVVEEKLAKNIIEERSNKVQMDKIKNSTGTSLEDFLNQNADEVRKTYKVIVKTDVQGTSQAVKAELESIKNEEVDVECIRAGVGVINENDILLAKASNAQIIGFNTKLDAKARRVADINNIEIKNYKIIYEAVDFVQTEIDKMKTPKFEEREVGVAEVRQLFKISSIGTIAGCMVLSGTVQKNGVAKLVREDEELVVTAIDTLQQQKDQVKQVRSGFECGIKLQGFNDIKVGDKIVVYERVQIN